MDSIWGQMMVSVLSCIPGKLAFYRGEEMKSELLLKHPWLTVVLTWHHCWSISCRLPTRNRRARLRAQPYDRYGLYPFSIEAPAQ